MTIGGSLGREEATARGALYCVREAVRKRQISLQGSTVAVQGFGNVGSYLAKFLAEDGATVIAISDSTSGLYNQNGIDVQAAIAHKSEARSLAGFRGADPISNEDLLLLECDVLAPCALEQVITAENADKVKAKIIVEGANGPVTPAATRSSRRRASSSSRTSSRTPAASSSPTSSGSRASRSTSGRRPRSTRS